MQLRCYLHFVSKGPEVDQFLIFKSQWPSNSKSKFVSLKSDKAGTGCLSSAQKVQLECRRYVLNF